MGLLALRQTYILLDRVFFLGCPSHKWLHLPCSTHKFHLPGVFSFMVISLSLLLSQVGGIYFVLMCSHAEKEIRYIKYGPLLLFQLYCILCKQTNKQNKTNSFIDNHIIFVGSINQHRISYNDWQWCEWLEISIK